jgi:hypothetical protein
LFHIVKIKEEIERWILKLENKNSTLVQGFSGDIFIWIFVIIRLIFNWKYFVENKKKNRNIFNGESIQKTFKAKCTEICNVIKKNCGLVIELLIFD